MIKDPSVRPAKLPSLLLSCALLTLPGCTVFSDTPHYRGIAVTQHDLNELTPGLSQQADVQALIGPPTFVEQFDQNNWVYVSQTTKMRIGQTEGLKNQHVVVMTFNGNGTLQTVSQKTMKDAVRVSMDSKQTPVPGGHAGFIQQLVGGVGSYNPLGMGATNTSAGGSGGIGNIGGTNSSGF
jgi:outer membrane protein assembly factor BamE (lipoprotein component of BamABCDE complex)